MVIVKVVEGFCGQPRHQFRALVQLVLISSVFKQQVKYGPVALFEILYMMLLQ